MGVAYIREVEKMHLFSLTCHQTLPSVVRRTVFPFNYAASSTASKILSTAYIKQALSGETWCQITEQTSKLILSKLQNTTPSFWYFCLCCFPRKKIPHHQEYILEACWPIVESYLMGVRVKDFAFIYKPIYIYFKANIVKLTLYFKAIQFHFWM